MLYPSWVDWVQPHTFTNQTGLTAQCNLLHSPINRGIEVMRGFIGSLATGPTKMLKHISKGTPKERVFCIGELAPHPQIPEVVYPLVNIQTPMENHNLFIGKSTISMAIFQQLCTIAITLKQKQLSTSSSGTQVASGSGLCSETWAWVESNFVFHLFSSSVLKNLALFKNNAEKLKQNKAHGFGICFFTYNPPISAIPSRIFQKT